MLYFYCLSAMFQKERVEIRIEGVLERSKRLETNEEYEEARSKIINEVAKPHLQENLPNYSLDDVVYLFTSFNLL